MNVILLEDIKGKGKTYDIKTFANGYANFLISNGKAWPATELNLAKRQRELDRIQDLKNDELMLAWRDQEALEGKEFTFYKKATPKGTTSESITKNDICEAIDRESISSKMLKTEIIKTFGTHTILVNRHPEVKFNIIVNVLHK